MNLDHVTIAASDLDRLSHAFARYGLEPEYGGPHANGVTHRAALGFRDGSYIELISFLSRQLGDATIPHAGPQRPTGASQNLGRSNRS